MSTTPGSNRPTRDPPQARPQTHTCTFRRKQRGSFVSTNHQRLPHRVRKSLKFEGDGEAATSMSCDNGSNASNQADSSSRIPPASHFPKDDISQESIGPAPHFWSSLPPPPSSPPTEGDTRTVNRRSMRLRTKTQFSIAQIADTSPNLRTEPTSDLLLRSKTQDVVFSQTSDYGTSSENSLYFKPSANSAFSFASAASSHSHCQDLLPRFNKAKLSKNSQASELSSQSVGYVSDLDDCLSNLSIDDVIANTKLSESKRWDSDEHMSSENRSEWEELPQEADSHVGLKDISLKNIRAILRTFEGIIVLVPLDGFEFLRNSNRLGPPPPLNNRYHLRNRSTSQLDRLIEIQTFNNFKVEERLLLEGLRVSQVSPIISVKPYEAEFLALFPAIIQIPLKTIPLPGDEVHCLYSRSPVDELETNFSNIPWKSVEAGKFTINNGSVYFEVFHFGLFVLIIRPKCPHSSKIKEIRTRVGGRLMINDFPSIEIAFPKEASDDVIIKAQASVYCDTEESVSEFLANRLLKQNHEMEVDDIGHPSGDCLATPILQLEPHGMHFHSTPVIVTLPVPDYDDIMKLTQNTAKLTIWQSSTQLHETARWEKLQVEYEVSKKKVDGHLVTVVTFPVKHFSFFKGVWESISSCLYEAKIGMLYYFVSFAMKCQANMEEYGEPTTSCTTAEEGGNDQEQKLICGGSRFGLEVSVFQADKPWPQMPTYKYKVGHSNPKLVKPGKIYIRLKSNYFIPDVQAGEEEDMVKEESDFRGRDFEKQFICKFKPDVKIERGPFGKVLITRSVSQRQRHQPLFEFNIQKHGNEADVTPLDYQSEQWSIVALRELASNLFVTDGDNWKQFAIEAGMTKQEIRDANLRHDTDPFQKIVTHYRQRGGTPEELVAVMYRCHRTIKTRGDFSPHSNQTKSSNGSSGRGSLSSNNAHFDRFGSHDSDTSGKTSGTRTSQDSGLPPGRKRSHQISNRGSVGGSSKQLSNRGSGNASLTSSSLAKRRRLSGSLPGPSRFGESQSDADEEASDSDLDRVPPPNSKAQSVVSVDEHDRLKNDKSVLNTHYLWQISEYLNVSSWRALGRTLGLEEAVLVEVDHGHSKTSFRECSYQMLIEWKNRFPKRCTYGILYQSLCKEGMAAAAKQMIEIDSTNC